MAGEHNSRTSPMARESGSPVRARAGHRTVLRGLLAAGALATSVASTLSVQAAETVTLHLQVNPSDAPDLLCVVSAAPKPRAGRAAALPAPSGLDLRPYLPQGDAPVLTVPLPLRPVAPGGATAGSPQHPLFSPTIAPASGAPCRQRFEACAPSLHLARPPAQAPGDGASPLVAVCARNSDAPASETSALERVAVVMLGAATPEASPAVSSLRLLGTSALLTVEPNGAQRPLLATVLGGSYLPDRARLATGDALQVVLRPLCRLQPLQLPPSSATPGHRVTVQVTVAQGPSRSCQATVGRDRVVQVMVPNGTEASVASAQVVLSSEAAGLDAAYGASWLTSAPPARIELFAERVSFVWVPHCAYPLVPEGAAVRACGDSAAAKPGAPQRQTAAHPWCPAAQLADTGTRCSVSTTADQRACSYVCESESDGKAPIVLPVQIRFERNEVLCSLGGAEGGDAIVWHDTLLREGQRLDGYEPGSQRRVVVQVPASRGGPGWVELHQTPMGVIRLRRDEARERVRFVPFPGESCGATVLVGGVGESAGELIEVQVRHGRLVLPAPAKQAGGGQSALDFLLGGQFGLWNDIELEEREVRNAPWLYAGYSRTQPLGAGPWVVGGNAGVYLGTRDFLRVRADPSDNPAADGVWFLRGVLEAVFERRLGTRWAAGIAAGGAVAVPVAAADRDIAGGFDAAWLAGAQVRFALSRKWELQGTTRALFGDQIYAYDADFAGDPEVHVFTRHTLLFGLGVRAKL